MRSLSLSAKLFAACMVLAALPLIATAASDFFRVSGLIGLSKGQTVTLNFTNIGREDIEANLYLLDRDGNLLKSSSARVMPGQSVSLEMTYREMRGMTQAARMQVRGVVRFVAPAQPDTPPPTEAQPDDSDLTIANLEVYDEATNKTSFGLLLPAVRNARVYFPFADSGWAGQ